MPTMRHPNGAGPYEAAEEQVNHMRMAGWLTAEEWEAGDLDEPFAPEPEPEPDEDEQAGQAGAEAAEAADEDTKPSRRSRPRANSKKED